MCIILNLCAFVDKNVLLLHFIFETSYIHSLCGEYSGLSLPTSIGPEIIWDCAIPFQLHVSFEFIFFFGLHFAALHNRVGNI